MLEKALDSERHLAWQLTDLTWEEIDHYLALLAEALLEAWEHEES